ncbi:thioesterase family protein [Azospirillum picis]|uniref:Acyl-CoA thioester hydrolase n=1 Tax=Azospirillum picis TaxID=488438 RepID=A0ABU0MET2_9PROT|nr:thioesterase family protein [Azospirillum picis]MBP2298107.1 acyl-CoA thioester hydrolase [Azospirillum picis]MDQ0531945.1 acyl-CoA thioester hydrolase [Azospirillum picis]
MTTSDPTTPLDLHRDNVRPEWIDYNGHMNVAYYLLAFDHATDAVLDRFGIGKGYVAAENRSMFVVDVHLTYAREVTEGVPLHFKSRLLGADAKRLHLFHEMRHGDDGWLAATAEFMLLHVDLAVRRACSFPPDVAAALAAQAGAQSAQPWPPQAGRAVKRLDATGR